MLKNVLTAFMMGISIWWVWVGGWDLNVVSCSKRPILYPETSLTSVHRTQQRFVARFPGANTKRRWGSCWRHL